MYHLGIRLQQLRKQSKLSQAQVAKELGVSRCAVGAYERNIMTPGVEVFIKMAQLYHVSLDYLAGLENRKMITLDDIPEEKMKYVLIMLDLLKK